MGFRTLALEQQASEVWKVLGAVKTEFERYGDWVEKVREQVQKAADTLDRADTRSRQMRRALKNVEALPEGEAQALERVYLAQARGIELINKAKPQESFIALKSFEALEKMANGQATKLVIPSNMQNLASFTTALKTFWEDDKK